MKQTLGIILCFYLLSCSNQPKDVDLNTLSLKQFSGFLDSIQNNQDMIELESKLSSDQAKIELGIYWRVLREYQTTLYRYRNETEVDTFFSDLIQNINDSVSYLDQLKNYASIQHFIACGHSSWSHRQDYLDQRNKNPTFFPFTVKIFKDRLFVDEYLGEDHTIKRNTEIVKIQGRYATDIITEMRQYAYQDGLNDRACLWDIEHFFSPMYQNFIDQSLEFEIELEENGEESKTLKVQGISKDEYDTKSEQDESKVLTFSKPEKSVLLYRINSFNNEIIAQSNQDFIHFTDSIFRICRAEKPEMFILDLRDNTGGWTANGKYLLEQLMKPGSGTEYIQSVTFNSINFEPIQALLIEKPPLHDSINIEISDSTLVWKNYPNLAANASGADNRWFRTIILINEGTRSSASIFASKVADLQLHETFIVGMESGTAQSGTGGMTMSIQMPYSGIILSLTTAEYTAGVRDATRHRGVEADFLATKDTGSADRVMKTALDLLSADIQSIKLQ